MDYEGMGSDRISKLQSCYSWASRANQPDKE